MARRRGLVLPKRVPRFSLLGIAFATVIGLAACGAGRPSASKLPKEAVAEVGSTPITKTAFEHWMAIFVASASSSKQSAKRSEGRTPVPVPPDYTACVAHLRATEAKPAKHKSRTSTEALKSLCAKEYSAEKQVTLAFLISSQWLIGEAADLGVKVTESEVEKELAKLKRREYPTQASYRAFIARSGYTMSDLLFKTEVEELLPERIEKKFLGLAERASVSRSAIEAYYKKHHSGFRKLKGRGAYVILTPTEAEARATIAKIRSGQSFAVAAKGVSILHTDEKGGVYLFAEIGRFPNAILEKAVLAAKPHLLSGPLEAPNGYYIFEVTKTTTGSMQPLSKVEDSIKAYLIEKKKGAMVADFPKTYANKWTAKTNCRTGYVIPDCRQYKAPKKTSTRAG